MNSSINNKSHKSILWKLSLNELQSLFDSSSSIKNILIKLHLRPYSFNYKLLENRATENKVSMDGFFKNRDEEKNKHLIKIRNKIPDELVFVENSKHSRQDIKRRVINQKIISYKCLICKSPPNWMNKKLSLQLDHINGVYDDNRIENLRFLCPNCHSQTENFAGKGLKKKYICEICSGETKGNGKCCIKCSGEKRKRFNPTKQSLEKMINDKIPFTKIGKIFGVSDNAVRKRCKKLNISIPKIKNQLFQLTSF